MFQETPKNCEISSRSQKSQETLQQEPLTTFSTSETLTASSSHSFFQPQPLPDSATFVTPKISKTASWSAQLTFQSLNKQARELAAIDYAQYAKLSFDRPVASPTETKKHMRNRSAFISRHKSRYYKHLLEERVKNGDEQRKVAVAQVRKISYEIELLRDLVSVLEARVNEKVSFESRLLDEAINS